MRVCIFSNSHVAMLKHADDAKPRKRWTPTFFAAPHSLMKYVKLDRGGKSLSTSNAQVKAYLARTSGGLEVIELRSYDAFVVFGLTAKTQIAMDLFNTFQPYKLRVSADARLISEKAFETAVRDAFAKTNAATFLRYLKATKKPLIFAPSPFPNEQAIGHRLFPWTSESGADRAIAYINELCVSLWREMADDAGATLLLQPPETIGKSGLTLVRYGQGTKRMNGRPFQENDPNHMNKAFGRLMLDEIENILLPRRSVLMRLVRA